MEVAERVKIGEPADVGGDGLQDVIAGEEEFAFGLIEAEVAGGMAGSEDEVERADGGIEDFAA